IDKARAQFRSFAAGQEHSPRLLGLLHLGLFVHPIVMDDLRNGVSMLGIIDGLSKQIFPWQSAKSLVSLGPSVYYPWHGHRMDTIMGHSSDALLTQKIHGKLARGPSAGVQAIELAGLGIPVEQEQVATHAIHHWLRHAQDGIGS